MRFIYNKNNSEKFMNKIEEIFQSFKISFNPNDEQAELASKRIEICNTCEFKQILPLGISRCTVCGCSLAGKMFTPKTYIDPGGSCPKGKWSEVEQVWLSKRDPNKLNQQNILDYDSYRIPDYTQYYSSYDGINYHNVILPTPKENNNYLADRIDSSLVICCKSTWTITIKTDNTDLLENLNLSTGQSLTFMFNGEKWIKNN